MGNHEFSNLETLWCKFQRKEGSRVKTVCQVYRPRQTRLLYGDVIREEL